MIDIFNNSRHGGKPVNLYLFKGVEPSLESLIRSVTIGPGATEFGYGISAVRDTVADEFVNKVANLPLSDFNEAVSDLLTCAPNIAHVSLIVAWHGTDLRAAGCRIHPKVEVSSRTTVPGWQVGPTVRSEALVVSTHNGKPAMGGAPSDRTLFEAISYLRSRNIEVTLHPIVLMDIPLGNTIPNPYGGTVGQPAYPSADKITCNPARGYNSTVDKTSVATSQINTFFGSVSSSAFSWDVETKTVLYSGVETEWSYRRFILHMATIAQAAGANDILIGSKLTGLTGVRGLNNSFPAVDCLKALAAEVRTIVGSYTNISYAADWTEYHSYKPNDGTDDVLFPLDSLWSDSNIDYIGINNFLPLGDWRNGRGGTDCVVGGYTSPYQKEYIQSNIEGGEYYDWHYKSEEDRNLQLRTLIRDDTYGEHWVYRQKDIRNWWRNQHQPRINGVRLAPSPWKPGSKPIVFTQVGVPAVEKGTNQPDAFIDQKSSESAYPYYSNQRPDVAIQRAGIEAFLDYWKANALNMVSMERCSVFTWDARPYPAFPNKATAYDNTEDWLRGHWLTGRLKSGLGFNAGNFGPYAFCDGETPITRGGITYIPFPISVSEINTSGSLDKSDITVTLARGTEMESEFIGFPTSQVVNLIVFQGHVGDDPTISNYPALWVGRVGSPTFENESIAFTCVPVSTSVQRPGLRRNYQLTCPHVLFGPKCRAQRKSATITRRVTGIFGNLVNINANLPLNGDKYKGGMIEWLSDGKSSLRTIVKVSQTNDQIAVRGNLRGVNIGDVIKITLGCNRLQSDCSNLHNNILNFGGQPYIPLENPLSQKSIFY